MKLSDWSDLLAVTKKLVGGNFRPQVADQIAESFARAAASLRKLGCGESSQAIAAWVPGRIEVLGKHTDYCGGQSLLAAAERGFCIVAAGRDDDRIRMVDGKSGERADFAMNPELQPRIGHWTNYPQTVARRMARNFAACSRGADIAFSSNLPPSAGMSSSSALIVGTFLVLSELNQLTLNPVFQDQIRGTEDLAGYLGAIENGSTFGSLEGDTGVGTLGGSQDHTAVLCARPGELVVYSFCPVRFERSVSLADRYSFAVGSSGVVAEKTRAARDQYNRVSLLAKELLRLLPHAKTSSAATLSNAVAAETNAGEALRTVLSSAYESTYSASELIERLEQFEIESRLISALPMHIDHDTVADFGRLVSESHDAANRLLHNQTPETNELATLAVRVGAHAASPFGAGFGGSIWALIDDDRSHAFLRDWRAAYLTRFPQAARGAEFFVTRPGPPAILWNGSQSS